MPAIGVNGLVLINLFFLAAVSGTTPNMPVSHPALPHPLTACSVVTRLDVEDAIGRQLSEGKEENEGPTSNCDYAVKGGLISITIQRLAVKPDLKVEFANLKKEIPEGTVRKAPGFPGAFYFDMPDAGTQLHIINANNEHLMISILGFGDASQVSGAAAQIARRAMKRL